MVKDKCELLGHFNQSNVEISFISMYFSKKGKEKYLKHCESQQYLFG